MTIFNNYEIMVSSNFPRLYVNSRKIQKANGETLNAQTQIRAGKAFTNECLRGNIDA